MENKKTNQESILQLILTNHDLANSLQELNDSVHMKVSKKEFTKKDKLYCEIITNYISWVLLGMNPRRVFKNKFDEAEFPKEYTEFVYPFEKLLGIHGDIEDEKLEQQEIVKY